MLQIPFSDATIAPGTVISWSLRTKHSSQDGQNSTHTSASFNQDKHHSSSEATRSTSDGIASSITVTFEIAGRLDTASLESALLLLVRRHEVLRSEFQRLTGDLNCTALAPESIVLETEEVGHFHTGDDLHTHLDKTFKSIDTLSWPLFLMGAVVRETSATVYLCFDHIVCDGLSMPVVVNELQTAYTALTAKRDPQLPSAGSYLTFGDDQRRRYASLRPDDDRLTYWKDFIHGNGGFFPRFPFDLGVPGDHLYPLVNRALPLLDAHRTDALAAGARASGGSVFTAVLAAAATAQHRFGGPGAYRGLLPISERTDERAGKAGGIPNPWQHSIGWFVNTMPIEFQVGEGGTDHATTIARARTAYGELQRHADIPFVRAWELLAPEAFSLHHWPFPVNFFSYIDFRRTPGGLQHPLWNATLHVWAARGNGISHWFHRTATGLHVNMLHVDTPQAHEISDALHDELVRVLLEIAGERNAKPVSIPRPSRGATTVRS
ncbi:condensation domain-containing protein [Streptomyces europaeiscabiei]|uniref:condensation domain-containing protein n=1 Tax=Streptomyces europaeiscabiei TaxID=146819 RepID=UPI0029A35C55|nr:condensation domain-containing protein [Streptomyces europaeiscabiei]MDX3840519.1 condensation domain-containing protein [Streptomyces europaeiscabiei]